MMTHRDALEVLAAHRRDQVVVTTMGSVAIWPEVVQFAARLPLPAVEHGAGRSARPRVVPRAAGTRGRRPDRRRRHAHEPRVPRHRGAVPGPLYILLIDNNLYEVTGGQAVANAGPHELRARLRAGAGIGRVYECAPSGARWEAIAGESLSGAVRCSCG